MAGPMNPILWTVYLSKLKQPTFEGNYPYMYVDSRKKITVGVGHNLTAHQDVQSLPFKVARFERHAVLGGDTGIAITDNKTIGRPATSAEKQNDYDFLNKHLALGQFTAASGLLQKYTTVELTQADIDAVFLADVNDAIDRLHSVFGPSFDTYPLSCQAALIDIQFNTGNIEGFPTLVKAVKGQDGFASKSASERWTVAGKESNRPSVQAVRNAQILQWFNQGAAETRTTK